MVAGGYEQRDRGRWRDHVHDDESDDYVHHHTRRRWGHERGRMSGSFLSRELYLKKFFGDGVFGTHGGYGHQSKWLLNSFLSATSSESNGTIITPTPTTQEHDQHQQRQHQQHQLQHSTNNTTDEEERALRTARVEALNERFVHAGNYKYRSSRLDEETLLRTARSAKKRVQAMATRDAIVGDWRLRRIKSSNTECQVLEHHAPSKHEYSIVAKVNLSCSLREMMHVLSTDEPDAFHRSMVALFGDQYVYGLNLRKIVLDDEHHERARRPTTTTSRRPSSSRHPRGSSSSSGFHNASLSVNAVSLLLRHHLLWRQQSLCFVDHVDEQMDALAVTRVLQTIDLGTRNSNQDEEDTHTTTNPDGTASTIENLTVGYVAREDPEARFTRLFFYATTTSTQSGRPVATVAKRLLRTMAETVCELDRVVLRRRLGQLCQVRGPMSRRSDPLGGRKRGSCTFCYAPFHTFRRRRLCACCGRAVCRACTSVEPIEQTIGMVDTRQICRTCLRDAMMPPLIGTVLPRDDSSRSSHLRGQSEPAFAATWPPIRPSTNSVGAAGLLSVPEIPELPELGSDYDFPPLLADEDEPYAADFLVSMGPTSPGLDVPNRKSLRKSLLQNNLTSSMRRQKNVTG